MSRPPLDLQRAAAAVICAGAGLFALWLVFRYVWGIALPFLLALLLSGLIRPLTAGICRRTRIPRGVCAAGLVLTAVGGAAALAVGGIRRGTRELGRLAEALAADSEGPVAAVEEAIARVRTLSAHIPLLRSFENASFYDALCERLDGLVESGASRLAETVTARLPSAAMTVAGWVPAAFVFLTVTLLACYYFTADDGRLGQGTARLLERLLPAPLWDRLPPLGRRLRRLGREYLRACLLLGGFTFLEMFIGLAVLRVPYAFILSLLIAAVDFLPLLGTGIILIPWAAVCLLLGKVKLGIGLLILYAVSSVLRQILEPKLIGQGLGLHPLLSLAAMYAGLRLFGVWGMILAPLVAAGIGSVLGVGEVGSGT